MKNQISKLRLFMEKTGHNQKEIAQQLGINSSIISHYMTGRSQIPRTFVISLKAEFGLNPEWFFNGIGSILLPINEQLPDKEANLIATIRKLSPKHAQAVYDIVDSLKELQLDIEETIAYS